MGARSPLLVSSVLMDADPEGTATKIKPKEGNGKEAEVRMTRSGSSKHQRSLTWSYTCPFRAGPPDGPWPGTARHGRRRARAGPARGPCRAWAGRPAHGDGPSTAR